MKALELKERLRREAIVFDGAIGTEIYRRNFFINTSFEQLSLTAPEVIRNIHQSYLDAGAMVMTTNTYSGNRLKLSRFGLAEKLAEINAASVKLAREVAGDRALVAGAVGPLEEDEAHAGMAFEEAADMLAEHGGTLLRAGADFLIFESLASEKDVRRAAAAAAALRESFGDFAFVLSFSTAPGNPDFAADYELARGCGMAAVGLNCGRGPDAMLEMVEQAVALAAEPLIVQPNVGAPRQFDNRTVYLTSPEYFSTYARRYLALGARGVGGCCGITPDHIRDMARTVRPEQRGLEGAVKIAEPAGEALRPAVPLAERSAFGAKLAAGAWLTSVEITPPRGFDLTATLEKARLCREAGIDAINLPDGPRASARLSALVTAAAIQREVGIETVLHVCGRDRSLLGLQADLLGCAAAGIRNLLFITGDPPKLGDYAYSSGVFDLDSIGLVKLAARLNGGLDAGGAPLGGQSAFVIAAGADPGAIDPEREYRRVCEKVEAGAEYIITQPVFDVAPLFRFLDRIAHLKVPVMAGVWPLASYRNAEFMRNEVPGVTVPDSIMERMAAVTGREEQRAEGIAIARELIAAIRERVAGVQVSAPLGNVATALAVHRPPEKEK